MQEFAKIVWNRLEHLLYFIFVKLLHLTFLDKNWAGFMQFVKFGMVGLSNTLLSYILNVMVLDITEQRIRQTYHPKFHKLHKARPVFIQKSKMQ